MRSSKVSIFLFILAGCALAAPAASWAASPVWRLTVSSQPTNFTSGEANDSFYPLYDVVATNIGGAATSGPVTMEVTLPPQVTPATDDPNCSFVAPTLTCTHSESIVSGQNRLLTIPVDVGAIADGTTLTAKVKITGGAGDASAETSNMVTPALPDFGFLPGPNGTSATLNEDDGQAVTVAGSHPDQLTVDLGFPSRRLGGAMEITGIGGGVRDLQGDGPPGFIGNPLATAELCTEAELEGRACPDESAVGVVAVLTTGAGPPVPSESPVFNMVPPPGTPAELGFDAAAVGIFVHVKASLRSDSDYGVSLITNDTLARAPNPVLGAQLQLWGDPTDPIHDFVRGECDEETGPEQCPALSGQETAFLTMPSACSSSLAIENHADSWIEPGVFRSAEAPITDPDGVPSPVDQCETLQFAPEISAQPTTNLTDSPSGLEFTLHLPQENKLSGRASAALKDATVTFPEGMTVNPSQADGLSACTPAQIGLTTPTGASPIHFNKASNSCPDAAKIGTLEVTTPVLDHSLPGSVYIAQPFQNPFGSLLAVYLTVEDPQSGIVAKLAGEVQADPLTGQLSTVFRENPQLPLEEVRVRLFDGPRAPLRTPPACGSYTTTASLTPWSSPKATPASDPFTTSAAPGGGTCPASAAAAPHSASFEAGTLTPTAATYSPFALKLSRADGTQPPGGLELTPPPGLIAKVAGVPYCPEDAITTAKSRERPNGGALEQADPSCPAASQIGGLDVGAGAGPTPFHTGGRVYLAGPYKGAPLSAVAITPAVAGPFDLGAVVVRAALYLDPESAQVRTLTDPLPSILEGIPLDVRSVALQLGRSGFTLNPTNCDPMAIEGKLTSIFGAVAPLSDRFQVGGCERLALKPKLSIRLHGKTNRGANPALSAVLRATPGQANLKRIAVALPRSEFLEQAHIGTVCTRVQFAADQCPAASVYGHARVFTPLLDQPLAGPVYLRSSSHKLPDVVLALHGQVDVVLDGRVDSINGGIRTTFEASPDAPFSKAVLRMKGGRKSLLVNSTNLCKLTPAGARATVKTEGHNGARLDLRPVLQSDCAKSAAKKRKNRRGRP